MFTIAHRFPATIFLLLALNFILTAQTADQDRTAKQKAVDASLYTACIDGDMPGVQRALRDGADVNAYNSNGRTPLIAAALSLHYPVIDVLLKAGARAEMQNDAGETAARLLGLAKTPPDVGESEGTALMRFMAEKKAYEKKLNDAAAPGTELARQLVSAVAKGDIPTAKQLIAKGAYVDFKDARSSLVPTVLIVATEKGFAYVVEELINKGVRIDRPDAQGRTALYYAVGKQNLEMVRLLVQKGGADPRRNVGEQTITAFAKTKPNKQIADLLVSAESERITADFLANAEKFDFDELIKNFKLSLDDNSKPGTPGTGLTADEKELFKVVEERKTLHFMVEGSTDRVIELLRKGTNANVRDASGKTPLMRAAENDDGYLIVTLRNHGNADLNAAMPDGTTALMLVAKADIRSAVDYLLHFGADKNLKDKSGKTAYDYAVQRNGEVLAKLGSALRPSQIVAESAPPKKTSSEKDQKLLEAVAGGRRPGQGEAEYGQVLSDLLASGSSPDTRDDRGRTLLMIAAETQNSMALLTLLKSKAAVDEQDVKGMTALMHAVLTDNIAIVSALLKAGAKTGIKNNAKRTAYDIAAEKKGSVFATSGYRLKPQ